MTTDDPRMGVPSCSALERLENCPSSWPLGKKAEAMGLVPPAGDDADSGIHIHKALETGDFSQLSDAENNTAERCNAQAEEIVDEFIRPQFRFATIKEHRLKLTEYGKVYRHGVQTIDKVILTGQADLIVVGSAYENKAVVVDYKTSRGEVTEAKRNAQLRGLSVLAGYGYNADHVRVAIVQPHAGPPSLADYDKAALRSSHQWLHWVIDRATESDGSDPKPGEWCRYCPARAICPAMQGLTTTWVGDAKIPEGRKESLAFRDEIRGRALSLPGAQLGALMDDVKLIEWHLEAVKSAARAKLEAGEEVTGWELGEKAGNRIIEDTDAASRAVAPLLVNAAGGPQAALLRCATLSAADLTDEIRRASGAKLKKDGTPSAKGYAMTERDAKDALEQALGDILTRGMKKTLQRKDETPEIETE